MKEREINREEYTDIEKHEYKGVHFFTAIYTDHVLLEPIHQEILDAINTVSNTYLDEPLRYDSAHSWARGLTLQAQRNRLVEEAHYDIDSLMSGESLKEQRKEYLEKRKKLREQYDFFKEIRKGRNENNEF